AMTTALSPESRMLIHMILRSATQNAVWPISPHPLLTIPSHVAESVNWPIEPSGYSLHDRRARGGTAAAAHPSNLEHFPGWRTPVSRRKCDRKAGARSSLGPFRLEGQPFREGFSAAPLPDRAAGHNQPTTSLPEKNCAISCWAVAAASEPCTE